MAAMTMGRAQLDLAALSREAEGLDETDIFVLLTERKVPLEVSTRLRDLWGVTRDMAGQVIHLGKIIIMKILEFVQEHPHAAIGMLIGAAIGALVNLIPWIGPLLAPLTTAIGAAYGFMVGSRLDHPEARSSFEGLIILAKQFFQVLAEIFNILKDKLLCA